MRACEGAAARSETGASAEMPAASPADVSSATTGKMPTTACVAAAGVTSAAVLCERGLRRKR